MRMLGGPRWYLSPQGRLAIQRWMQYSCALLGLRIQQFNRPRVESTLFIANHISFLDIPVVSSIVPVRFLAKHTVRYWPVIGMLTQLTGSVFIQRAKRSLIHRSVDALDVALRETRPVAIFPEGTTGLGDQVKKFHTGLFQAAIDSATPVQAIALRYLRQGRTDRIAAYIDKDNFVAKLLAVMAQPYTDVQVHFCAPLFPEQRGRQRLARQAREQIELVLMRG
ncbi:MAG: 1-acyl-sn-glycerol-3-phosphate acyltransferase [Gammaproteobacteria bacterium]|nr:1-acyl-sn-glycerol-3-phosphate acyltransferase [Gammaproteobacteria bacterium]